MDNKPTLIERLTSLRVLFLLGNVILMVIFLLVIAKDQTRGWRPYQIEFKHREIARLEANVAAATNETEKQAAEDELRTAKKMPIEIRQIWSQDMKAIDRCITCHLGYDSLSNPAMTTEYKDHPYLAPANSASFDIHKAHNTEKFGCVVCHGGQGLATEVKAAHGEVEHWEKPLLKGALLQASCAKCHDNVNELNIQNTNYTAEIIRAKTLFKEHGCIGCHQIAGEGGPISVDLKEETSAKPLSRIDFSSTGLPHDEWTLTNWIKLHLVRDPVTIVPGDPDAHINTEPIAPSAMPPFMMPEKDANALTAYILGLNRREVPQEFLVLRPKEAEPTANTSVARGRLVYEKFGCGGCHGQQARGGIRNYNYFNDVTPNLRRAVASYTREELRDKISHGVPIVAKNDFNGPLPPLYMPAWGEKIKGQDLDDLITYLQSIKE